MSQAGSGPQRTKGSGLSLNVALRAVVTAVAFVTFMPGALAIVGAFAPRLPTVGPFGSVVNTGYPWIVGDLIMSAALAEIVVLLGGRRAAWLLAANLVVLAGATLIGYRFVSFAAEHGATYDLLRAADGYPPIGDAETKVVFASVGGIDLHAGLWLPDNAHSATARSLPAVVFVHGGAFQAGGLWNRPTLMEAIDRAGIVGIDIEYRLAPPPRWEEAPADVLCALAWVGTTDELAMVDTARVVLVGESAGGSLVLVAGYAAGTDAVTSSCPGTGAPIVPAGVVALSPTADLQGIWHDATISDYAGTTFPEAYLGGPPDEVPERYAAAEPFRLLRPDLPPTLMVVGEIDRLVRIERQNATVDRIRAAGAPIELVVAPYGGHGFDGEPNSFGAQLVEGLVPAFVERVTGAP